MKDHWLPRPSKKEQEWTLFKTMLEVNHDRERFILSRTRFEIQKQKLVKARQSRECIFRGRHFALISKL